MMKCCMVVRVVKELNVALECIRIVVGHPFSEGGDWDLCVSLCSCVFCMPYVPCMFCVLCMTCVGVLGVVLEWFLIVCMMVVIDDRPS